MRKSNKIMMIVFIFVLLILGSILYKFNSQPNNPSNSESLITNSNNSNLINTQLKSEMDNNEYDDFSIKVGEDHISLYALEDVSNLEKILGKPINVRIEEITPCAEHQGEDLGVAKVIKYDGIEIWLNASNKLGPYKIVSIYVTSDKFSTVRGIRVGDTFEKLKEVYPEINFEGNEVAGNRSYFFRNKDYYYDVIDFYFDGILKQIVIQNDEP